jgi:hypothetical protein
VEKGRLARSYRSRAVAGRLSLAIPHEMFRRLSSYQDERPSRIFNDDINDDITDGRLTMRVKSNVKAGGGLATPGVINW